MDLSYVFSYLKRKSPSLFSGLVRAMVWTSLLSVVTIIWRSGIMSVLVTLPDTRCFTALSLTRPPALQVLAASSWPIRREY